MAESTPAKPNVVRLPPKGKPRPQTTKAKAKPAPAPAPDPTDALTGKDLAGAIEMMAGLGLPDRDIAIITGLDVRTMSVRFADVLASGRAKANFKVSNALFVTATDRKHPKHVSAAIFWAKARLGWVEATNEGGSQSDGNPETDDAILTSPDVYSARFDSVLESLRDVQPKR